MKQVIDRTQQPPVREMEEFDLVKPDRRTMRNGMTLNVIKAGTEDVVRVDFVIGGGQLDQECPLQALMANRMLREGTASFTSAQIAEKLDYYGAWLDISSSATHNFVTLYSLNKYFEQTMAIVADMLKAPRYPEKELGVVVDANRQQFLVNSQRVEMLSRRASMRAFFGRNHPLGRLAELEDYDRICPDLLQRYYRSHYSSYNCTMFVSGHITAQVIRCIEHHMGDEPWGENRGGSTLAMPQPQTVAERRITVPREDGPQSAVKVGGFVMDRLHPDYLKTKVMVTLLGGYFGSRLMSNIREDKGYTYGVAAGIINYPEAGLLLIGTETDNRFVEPVIREIYHEIDRLHQERVGEDELAMVRNYMLGELSRAYEGPFALSDAWIYVYTGGLSDSYFAQSLDAIRSCTPEDIQHLAQKYLRTEDMKEVVAGKNML